jgi:FAD synthase
MLFPCLEVMKNDEANDNYEESVDVSLQKAILNSSKISSAREKVSQLKVQVNTLRNE